MKELVNDDKLWEQMLCQKTLNGCHALLYMFHYLIGQVRRVEMGTLQCLVVESKMMDKEYWTGLIDWMKEIQLSRGLVSAHDFDCIHIVDTPEEVFQIISDHHSEFRKEQQKK